MTTIPVVAAVVRQGDRFLLGLRPADKRHGGLWEFPGGKVSEGESDAEALVRELFEELGVAAEPLGGPLAIHADPGSMFSIRFVPARLLGEPFPLEHDALRWVTAEEAREMRLAPSDARFVREALDAARG